MNIDADHESMCVQENYAGLVLTTDPKPRLRWTVELHQRFVDAVTQLGGPDKATPKTIMRVMGVKGLTLYHLKSHLQKFRMGKQTYKELNDSSMKDELQRNNVASSSFRMLGRSTNEMQMEVNRRLHEQLEVQRRLQLRIEAQGKYMQAMLQKACQTLATGTTAAASGSYGNPSAGPEIGGLAASFPCLQGLSIYCSNDGLDQYGPSMERSSSSTDSMIMPSKDSENFLTRKRSDSYSRSGKDTSIWADDLRLQGAASCIDIEDQIQNMVPFPLERIKFERGCPVADGVKQQAIRAGGVLLHRLA